MKALTVRQPWAWAIAHGGKSIENRTRRTNYRGKLYIHAGAAYPHPMLAMDVMTRLPVNIVLPDREDLLYGAIIATAELVDCVFSPGMVGNWGEPQAWHWMLANIKPLKRPILNVRGQLGLWEFSR